MKLPISTYRVQLSENFPLEDLQQQVEYLHLLGISTVYAAPLFRARGGSTHGYDVLDPYTINKEIGSLQTFRELRNSLQHKGMTWLQDIVPNHMAFDGNNPWLRDIFELGPNSNYYHYFDIDWKASGKVMAPFLGAPLEEVLEQGDIEIKYDRKGFSLNYFDHSYPASAGSYEFLLEGAEVGNWMERFRGFSGSDPEWEDLKMGFFREVQEDHELKDRINASLERINESSEALGAFLQLQYFVPVHWKQTEKEISYRRFFTINDLICLRMEDPEVFESYHYFIKELYEQGMINSLRIDHIDGLFDPEGYLQNLRELVGEETYIIVEKILESEEELPEVWPVQGSSGYDFLAQVNQLFTEEASREEFTQAYKKINPDLEDYEVLVFEKKLFILKHRMGGELQNLWESIQEKDLLSGVQEDEGKEVLAVFLASFPVYRIYPQKFPLSTYGKETIQAAYEKALAHLEDAEEILNAVKAVFMGEAEKEPRDMLYFLQRCQQFTGPLAAKGVEDTVFYIYNHFISHSEVGDSPRNFGMSMEAFHEKMLQKKEKSPFSMNATATHDTKRGEDARMRLNVLSEIPQEWFSKFEEWQKIAAPLKKEPQIPDANEEYFLYQTLIGGFPFAEEEGFQDRVNAYLQKALREAKVHSNWAAPDDDYEAAVFEFVGAILSNRDFRSSFDPFQKKLAYYGAIKSLGQCLIKSTAPGIPDIYQGTEFWDFSFVDPDNRRPVDYVSRLRALREIISYQSQELQVELNSLKSNFSDGMIKLFTLSQVLAFRKNHREIFEEGEYLSLEFEGDNSDKMLSYARRIGDKWVLVVVPVLVTAIFDSTGLIPRKNTLDTTVLKLPVGTPKNWINILTNKELSTEGEISIQILLTDFPVVLLTNV